VLSIAAIVATFGLFVVIAALQSRWISQLSEAKLQRSKIRLQMSLRAVQTDFNRELNRAYVLFQWEAGVRPETLGQRTSETYVLWRRTSEFPDLIQRFLLVRPAAIGGLEMAAYNRATREYDSIAWPSELQDLRKQLALPFKDYGAFGVRTFTGITLADSPVLVFPLARKFRQGLPGDFPDAAAWLLVELDQRLLLAKVLPQSIRDNLDQPDQFDY
jgi:hypothetical protein